MAAKKDSTARDLNTLLHLMIDRDASDMFITAGLPPTFKVHGKTSPMSSNVLTAEQSERFARQLMNDKQNKEFDETLECNFALNVDNKGRFRVNVFKQKNQTGLVLRKIQTQIPGFEQLGLPEKLKELSLVKRGLTIITGSTASGKSTTLASMIEHRNQNSHGHIVTIEDPIEFIHEHGNCVITQREVGVDTKSFEAALKNTLRQAPDVILIGEIRSQETMQHAIAFAETGHLCLATLHSNNAYQTLDRILNFFPEERHKQLMLDLSLNLNSIVSQQLVPKQDGKGRVLAMEVLLNTPLISSLIHKGEFEKIREVMKKSTPLGMQTFEQSLFDLYNNGTISLDDAMHFSDEANELRLMIKLSKEGNLEDSIYDDMTLIGRQDL